MIKKWLGRVYWEKPHWALRLNRLRNNKPFHFWGSVIGLVILILLGIALYTWLSKEPKNRLQAVITPLKSSGLDEAGQFVPDKLVINFGLYTKPGNHSDDFIAKPVAKLNQLGSPITAGISLNPFIKGNFQWENDSQLTFVPQENWKPGETYRIKFDPSFFPPYVKMKQYEYAFKTPDMTPTIQSFNFYQDPINASKREVVATLIFNYAVDLESLKHNIRLTWLTNAKKATQEAIHFSLKSNAYHSIVYLTSEPIKLSDEPRYVLLSFKDKFKTTSGKTLFIPDQNSYFRILHTDATIVKNKDDQLEQALSVETSLGVTENALKNAIHAYLLPVSDDQKPWLNPGQVTAQIIEKSDLVELESIPAPHHYSTLHSFRFKAPANRYLYIKIDKGLKGFGDFSLNNNWQGLLPVPLYPQEIGFIHKGALLALSGEKNLSVWVRGLPYVKFNFSRVLPDNINQLVTQTEGDFNDPYFLNQSFNQQNISEIFSETQHLNAEDPAKPQYTVLHFAKYLSHVKNDAQTLGPHGLFLLEAQGWDNENQVPLSVSAKRLILITDMGLIAKSNYDGSRDLFVTSITKGGPLSNVLVSILGKNGLPIAQSYTDVSGRAHFATLTAYTESEEPVVYLASLNEDISFIPFQNATRKTELNYSRFDTGGLYSEPGQEGLNAFLFTDRGIYRPGDFIHLAMIVKKGFAHPAPASLPLALMITDPNGNTFYDESIVLNETGFLSKDIKTESFSLTGQYLASLYIVKDDKTDNLVGSTPFELAEFQPDTMRIQAEVFPKETEGWVNANSINAKVYLQNLYGAPAMGHKVSATLVLSPLKWDIKRFPDYVFTDPLRDPEKPLKTIQETLKETDTNANGEAQFNIALDRYREDSYELTLNIEGFQAESGRSVATQKKLRISPYPYLVAYKPQGDLNFIQQNSETAVSFIAINPELNQVGLKDLTLTLSELKPISTLVKNPNGTFEYRTVTETEPLSSRNLEINSLGTLYQLPTDKIGHFQVTVWSKAQKPLSQFTFEVVGNAQLSFSKSAVLNVKLDQKKYHAGDTIRLQIVAPYTGSGLITLERDKVYQSQWFKTDTTSSIQSINIPKDFEGNGYVNVTFVRDWNSPEIFMNPLSFNVSPFELENPKQRIEVDLKTPNKAEPGTSFKLSYRTSEPAKLLLFAIDEGILQVAHYVSPNPLAFFFQKRALSVVTAQTLDLILPKFNIERERMSVGGDNGMQLALLRTLNPFKRKTELPMAFWSNILDADNTAKTLSFDLPPYFNGALRIIGVAVSKEGLGFIERNSEIKGPFVITLNAPTFVSPNDSFEVSATIVNNLEDKTSLHINMESDDGLTLIGAVPNELSLTKGQQKTITFTMKANQDLGNASIHLEVNAGTKKSRASATLSIRPASPFETSVKSGMSQGETVHLPLNQNLYSQDKTVQAMVSTSPLILTYGLKRYLDNFPYGCTEQLVSKVYPLLALKTLNLVNEDTLQAKMDELVGALSARQMSSGAFSYWPGFGENTSNAFATVYAMDFLTEANAAHFKLSENMFQNGISYLKSFVSNEVKTLDEARIQAYAIYVLTKNEIITADYIAHLETYLNQHEPDWSKDILSAYLAASFSLLQDQKTAQEMIGQYKIQSTKATEYGYFYDANTSNAIYMELVARYFKETLPKVRDRLLPELINALNQSEINTLLSSFASLALEAVGEVGKQEESSFQIDAVFPGSVKSLGQFTNQGKINLSQDEAATEVIFKNNDKRTFYYQLIESGFDKRLPNSSSYHGLEVIRSYRDKSGNEINEVSLGDEVVVNIELRAIDSEWINNIVIVDLLPGGFEVVQKSPSKEFMDYVDVREDRVIFYGAADSYARKLTYRIKAISRGDYQIAPIFAQALYDPQIFAKGIAGRIKVQ